MEGEAGGLDYLFRQHGTIMVPVSRSRFQGSLDAQKNPPIVPTFDVWGDQREEKGRPN
jgi:hypothetical protein